jgi:hypothetical protein
VVEHLPNQLKALNSNPSAAKVKLYQFTRAAIIKCHRVNGLSHRNLFSHSSGRWKFKIKMLTDLVSSEASLLGLQMTALSLCPNMVISLTMYMSGVPLFIS